MGIVTTFPYEKSIVTFTCADVCPCNSHGTCSTNCVGLTYTIRPGTRIPADGTSKLTCTRSSASGSRKVFSTPVKSLNADPKIVTYDPGAMAVEYAAASTTPAAVIAGTGRAVPENRVDKPPACANTLQEPDCGPSVATACAIPKLSVVAETCESVTPFLGVNTTGTFTAGTPFASVNLNDSAPSGITCPAEPSSPSPVSTVRFAGTPLPAR